MRRELFILTIALSIKVAFRIIFYSQCVDEIFVSISYITNRAGVDPGCSLGGWGGGGQKIMWVHAHHVGEAGSPFRPGSRARLRALPEALGAFDALLCYLSLIFKHYDTNWD